MPDYLLSVELSEDRDQLVIHGDEKGLRYLIEQLERLIVDTKEAHFNHVHLMTPEWGGNELSPETQGGTVLNHVEVYCWKGKP